MRPCIPPPPPPRDTLPSPAPDLDDLDDLDGEPADSGVWVIDPQRAADMRAEWAALAATDPAPPAWAVLDAETSPATWSLYR